MAKAKAQEITREDLKEHPQLYILTALRQASDEEARLLLRCIAEIARSGFKRMPPVVIGDVLYRYETDKDTGCLKKMPPVIVGISGSRKVTFKAQRAVFMSGEEIELPELDCKFGRKCSYKRVRLVGSVKTTSRGTWIGFTEEARDGINELLGKQEEKR